jgi:undecaprenyl-diphosphatase
VVRGGSEEEPTASRPTAGATARARRGADREQARGSRHRRARGFQAALLAGAVAFGALALVAHTVRYFPLDLTISRDVQAVRAPWLGAVLGAVSWIGLPPQSSAEFGAIILALFLAGRRLEASMALFAAAGSAALWFVVAPLVDRPRPTPDLIRVAAPIPWGSFPSGHVLNLTAFFGFLFFLGYVLPRPSWRRTLALAGCGTLIVLIGLARIYSGEHWPSDVLGGYMLGGLWLALTIHLYRARQRPTRTRGGPNRPAAGRGAPGSTVR